MPRNPDFDVLLGKTERLLDDQHATFVENFDGLDVADRGQ